MRIEKQTVSHKEVAQSYFGITSVNRTMTMMASLAIRLPSVVLAELGEIVNSEHPRLFTTNDSIGPCNAGNEQEALRLQDCRIFRSFLKLNSLYGSTVFMNHAPNNCFDAQINTLHRLKDYSSMHNYCSVHHEKVTEEFKICIDALSKEKNSPLLGWQ